MFLIYHNDDIFKPVIFSSLSDKMLSAFQKEGYLVINVKEMTLLDSNMKFVPIQM